MTGPYNGGRSAVLEGIGAYCDTSAVVHDNVFVNNSTTVIFTTTIPYEDTSLTIGGVAYHGPSENLSHNLIWNNFPVETSVDDWQSLPGMIWADPRYTDSTNGQAILASNSPCVGAASDSLDIGPQQSTYGPPQFLSVFVNPVYADSSQNGRVDYPFATIQTAVDASVDGDTLQLTGGMYTGTGNRDINVVNKGLVIHGPAEPDIATIDCEADTLNPHRAFMILGSGQETCRIAGVTIQNAYPPEEHPTQPSYFNRSGGAILLDQVDIEISNVLFTNNDAEKGASVLATGSTVSMQNCQTAGMSTVLGDIYVFEGRLEVTACSLTAHTATSVVVDNSSLLLESSLLQNATEDLVYSRSSSPVEIVESDLSWAGMAAVKSYGRGGTGLKLFVDGCSLTNNGEWGVHSFYSADTTVISDCRFLNNNGAVFIDPEYAFHGSCFIIDCLFEGNIGQTNGVIEYGEGMDCHFDGCTFVDNSMPGAAVIYASPWTDLLEFSRCLIAYNNVLMPIYAQEGPDPAEVTVNCCDVFGNSSGDYVGTIEGLEGLNDNISSDPLFCDTGSGDYQIDFQSPCAPAISPCGQLIGCFDPGCSFMNTPVGSDVEVTLDSTVTVTFDNVTQAGFTNIWVDTAGPVPPSGYVIVPAAPPVFYQITSTASWTDSIEICLAYDEEWVSGDERDLVMFHFSDSSWTDITTGWNTIDNIVCGRTATLSPFVLCLPGDCCQGLRGNLDGSVSDEPTLGDLTVMIDHLFISLAPLGCWEEGNLDGSLPEGAGSVTLGDLTVMIDNLFISLSPLPPCP